MGINRSTLDLLNQTLWVGAQSLVFLQAFPAITWSMVCELHQGQGHILEAGQVDSIEGTSKDQPEDGRYIVRRTMKARISEFQEVQEG